MVRIQGATASLLLIFSLNTLKGVFAQTSSDNSTSEDCASFGRSLDLPNVSVDIAEFVPNGTNLTFPYNVSSTTQSSVTHRAKTDIISRTSHVVHHTLSSMAAIYVGWP